MTEKVAAVSVTTEGNNIEARIDLSEALGKILGEHVVTPMFTYILNMAEEVEELKEQNRVIFEYLKAQKEGNSDSIEVAYSDLKMAFEKTFSCDCGGTYRFSRKCNLYVCDKCGYHKLAEHYVPVFKNRFCPKCGWEFREEKGLWENKKPDLAEPK